ncbi:hypothetical protein BDW66DRAFT_150645 [Aspergillus desertorum]
MSREVSYLRRATLKGFHCGRVNFRTGERVHDDPYPRDPIPSLLRYRVTLEQVDSLNTGPFYLPNEDPEVLLTPFREFVEANNLHDAPFVIWTFSDALGDILKTPLLSVLQLAPQPGISARATFCTKARPSRQLKTQPPWNWLSKVRTVSTDSFAPKNCSLHSRQVCPSCKVRSRRYGALPVQEVEIHTTQASLAVFPAPPYECLLDVHGYYRTRLEGNESFTEEDAQRLVLEMSGAGTYPINDRPETIAFESHFGTSIMAPVDGVREGFYRKLYALQAQRSTYYTGCAFYTDYSTRLWNYMRAIVDMMTAELSSSTSSDLGA